MFTKAVAVYFRELREGQGFTQESLAEAARCSKRTVERLERRERPISVASLERLIAVLGASPDEVNYLMTNASATEDEARELAQALLHREPARRWSPFHEPASAQDPGLIGIHAYIQTLRERQGISRKALADTLGVGIATYANWEAGRGTMMPFPVLVRLATLVGGTLEDLERISLASEGHEELGKRLADDQLAAFQRRQSAPRQQRDSASGSAYDGKVLRRITAIEGVLHALLGLLKRLLPDAAEEIERTSVLCSSGRPWMMKAWVAPERRPARGIAAHQPVDASRTYQVCHLSRQPVVSASASDAPGRQTLPPIADTRHRQASIQHSAQADICATRFRIVMVR